MRPLAPHALDWEQVLGLTQRRSLPSASSRSLRNVDPRPAAAVSAGSLLEMLIPGPTLDLPSLLFTRPSGRCG